MWRLGFGLDSMDTLDSIHCLFVRLDKSQACSGDGSNCGEKEDEKGMKGEGGRRSR